MLEKARPDELESIQHQIAFGHLGQAHINRWTANADKAKRKNKKTASTALAAAVKKELASNAGGSSSVVIDGAMRDDVKEEM